MALLLIALLVILFGWMGLVVLSGAASATKIAMLLGNARPGTTRRISASQARDRVLLVLLAAGIVGIAMRLFGIM